MSSEFPHDKYPIFHHLDNKRRDHGVLRHDFIIQRHLFVIFFSCKVNCMYIKVQKGSLFFSDFENESTKITALRLLCCLLPTPNRDTLKVLLNFLAEVASFAEDRRDENGIEVSLLKCMFPFCFSVQFQNVNVTLLMLFVHFTEVSFVPSVYFVNYQSTEPFICEMFRCRCILPRGLESNSVTLSGRPFTATRAA